jgi:hypothetical protein
VKTGAEVALVVITHHCTVVLLQVVMEVPLLAAIYGQVVAMEQVGYVNYGPNYKTHPGTLKFGNY